MEAPSQQLMDALQGFGLCTPADLRRCRRRVRSLARDLPTFDSVWIDALVQVGRLTLFQAHRLDGGDPQPLAVGPCLLVDRLPGNGRHEAYRARRSPSGDDCELVLTAPGSGDTPALARLQAVVEAGRAIAHPAVQRPSAVEAHDGQLAIELPRVAGHNLHELVVRRGRFPVTVVVEIANQLIEGLCALEDAGLVHGDIRPANVRLTTAGRVVLCHTSIAVATEPTFNLHELHAPECYDGTAPELIASDQPADARTEMYALGCLLWQLLAGRPPFIRADVLGKLAAHQSRSIDDIRELAPDTPADLATLIGCLTEHDPDNRPPDLGELRKQWTGRRSRGATTSSPRQLVKFAASFQSSVSRSTQVRSSMNGFQKTVLATLLLLTAGTVGAIANQGTRHQLLRIAGHTMKAPEAATRDHDGRPANGAANDVALQTTMRVDHGRQPFPTQPVDGVITLDTAGPYDVADLAVVGSLVIRGAEGVTPQIVVGDRPLRIWCEQLVLENVRFTHDPQTAAVATLLDVQTQNLLVNECRFEPTESISIDWTLVDEADPGGGQVLLEETHFVGPGTAIRCRSTLRRLSAQNVLKVGRGAFVELAGPPRTDIALSVEVRNTTLRDANALLRWSTPAPSTADNVVVQPTIPPVHIRLTDAVFALAESRSAILLFDSNEGPTDWNDRVRITGEGSIMQPETTLAGVSGGATVWNASQMSVEGLLIDGFEFAGPLSGQVSDALVSQTFAPRRSPQPPGLQVRAKLPVSVGERRMEPLTH